MKRIERLEGLAVYAKQLGFNDVKYTESSFKAEDTKTGIAVWAGTKYGRWSVEVSRPSSGTPKPTSAKILRFIRMLQNAFELKKRLS